MPTQTPSSIEIGEEILEYRIQRSLRRRRSMSMMVEGDGSLRILAPILMRTSVIEGFVRERSSWILKRLAHIRAGQKSRAGREYKNGAKHPYLGQDYVLEIVMDAQSQGCAIVDGVLRLTMAVTAMGKKDLQAEARTEISLWYKKQARAVLKERLDYWSAHLKIPYRKLSFSNAEHRWGSCDGRDNIRLNWRLIMAPMAQIDYVIVHELCHVIHKNHAPVFWKLVASFMPDYKSRRKALHTSAPCYEMPNNAEEG